MQNIYSCTTAAQKANSLPAKKNFSASLGYQTEISKSVTSLYAVLKFLRRVFGRRRMKQGATLIDRFYERNGKKANDIIVENLYSRAKTVKIMPSLNGVEMMRFRRKKCS